MSVTLRGDVSLRAVFGPKDDLLLRNVFLGSTASIYFDAISPVTGEIVPVIGPLAAIYHLPDQSDFPSQTVSAFPTQYAPGRWRVDVPTVMTGPYTVSAFLNLPDWTSETESLVFQSIGVAP